jgi:hypothetical protein
MISHEKETAAIVKRNKRAYRHQPRKNRNIEQNSPNPAKASPPSMKILVFGNLSPRKGFRRQYIAQGFGTGRFLRCYASEFSLASARHKLPHEIN